MNRTFKVTSPDGAIVEVEAPDSASDNDLIALAQSKLAAQPTPATSTEKFLASGAGRFLKGQKDVLDAGAQLLPRGLSAITSLGGLAPNRVSDWLDSEVKRLDTDIQDSEREYQTARFKAGQSGFDGMRTAGSITSPANYGLGRLLPIKSATTLGRAGQGLLTGGVTAPLVTPVTDTSDTSFAMQKGGQALSGAVGGAIFAPIAGKVVDVVAPRLKALQARFTNPEVLGARASLETDAAISKALRDAGIPEGEVGADVIQGLRQQVLEAFKGGQRIDAAAQLRANDFKAQGLPALRGQISRDPAQYSRDLNMRGIEGVGEPIQNVLTAQNQGITSGLSKYGGTNAMEPFQAGEMFNASLKALDDRLSSEVSSAYRNARASSGKDWDVPIVSMAQRVQNIVDDFGVGGEKNAVPTAIYNRLKTFGVVGDGMTQRKAFNYEEADKLLKQINAHDDGTNGSIGALRAAVKDALTEGGGEGDPFAVARRMAGARFKLLDAIPALESAAKAKNPQELSRLSDDFVKKHVVNAKVADLRKLAEVLPDEAKQEAKRQIASVIYRGAFRNNITGDKAASPAGLQDALRQIGSDRLKVFFSPDEIAELQRLSRITGYANTEPAWGTVARGGNPGGVLFGGLARLGGIGGRVATTLPIINATQNSLRAQAAVTPSVPKAANLTSEEVAQIAGLLGGGSAAFGGLLAPRP